MLNKLLLGVCVPAVLISGCSTVNIAITEEKPDQPGTVISYNEGESGKELFPTRMFVNKDYVRIDGHGERNDFRIYDRHVGTLYQVRTDKKQVDAIRARTNAGPLPEYTIEVESEESALIEGGQAQHHVVKVNGEVCRELVTVKDMLPDVLAAITEMDVAMSGKYTDEQIARLDACTLALNVYYPKKLRELGFPAREWDEKGNERFIADFSEGMPPPKNFTRLPSGLTLREFGSRPVKTVETVKK